MIYRLIVKITPKSFMRLPPEVRNQIYQLLLPDQIQTVRLRRCENFHDKTWSLLGFANSNRQIRSELHPLIFKKFNVQLLHFLDVPAFIDSFYSHIHEKLQPRNVRTKVTRDDSRAPLNWDMHALLLAKDQPQSYIRLDNEPPVERSNTIDWSPASMFGEYAKTGRYERGWTQTLRPQHEWYQSSGPDAPDYGKLYEVIYEPLFGSSDFAKELVHDVWARFITDFRFQWDGDCKAVWTLTVANKYGKLGSIERHKLYEYAKMFLKHQHGGHVTIHVTDFKGTSGEEWFTYGHKPLVQETGQKPKDIRKR